MTEKEYKVLLQSKSKESLVDIVIKQIRGFSQLRDKVARLEEDKVKSDRIVADALDKVDKMSAYLINKEKALDKKDSDIAKIVSRYMAGESAYQISKDTGICNMTIINRLKKANVYEGKAHVIKKEAK